MYSVQITPLYEIINSIKNYKQNKRCIHQYSVYYVWYLQPVISH